MTWEFGESTSPGCKDLWTGVRVSTTDVMLVTKGLHAQSPARITEGLLCAGQLKMGTSTQSLS